MKSVEQQVTALAVSPYEPDHLVLERLFAHSNWSLTLARDLSSAKQSIERGHVSVILCEQCLPDGTWCDLLRHVSMLENPPKLVVTSRLADAKLWGEVLNLGGFDVLEKPFIPAEVYRVVAEAWRRYRREEQVAVA